MLRNLITLVWIGAIIAVAAGPLPVLRTNCIPPGSYCMDTLKPCCQPAALQDGHVRHHEHICFIFGQGLCQPLLAIPRLNLYVSLVRQLNSTNYMELRRSYRQKLDNSTTAERTDLDLLLLVPSPMKPIAITALRDRGRIILSPEQRADWSQPKPQTPTTTTYRPSNYNEA